MGDYKNTIELNGKVYDARSGKIISDIKKTENSHNQVHVGKVVDGFVRPAPKKEAKTVVKVNVSSESKPTPTHNSANHTKRLAQKSHTLIRTSVKKPDVKSNTKTVRPKFIAKTSHADAVRITKAQTTAKSPLITKFGKTSLSGTVHKTSANLPVVSPPSNFGNVSKAMTSELEKFEQSIKNATSHLEKFENDMLKKVPFLKRVGFKNQALNLATMSLAVLLLGGFFAYQNSAYLSMKFAANKAGIAAKFPKYTPAGFGVSRNVHASDGKVTVSFRSHTDERNYILTEQASDWNSSSLLASYVSKRCDSCYQSWDNQDKTIYTYDSNATWVDGGIWYTIEGNSNLTTDQLQNIANSL